jgi:predicted nucleic acid-binding protein
VNSFLLIDTGPLVALLRRADSAHGRCVAYTRQTSAKLVTCWPVLTEAAWLLRHDVRHLFELLRYVADEEVSVYALPQQAAGWMREFMNRFSDQNPQLADVALMYIAEHEAIDTIFTLDRRDFSVFRTSENQALMIVPD